MKNLIASLFVSVALIALAAAYFFKTNDEALAGVPIGNDYHATTTNASSVQNNSLCSTSGTKSSGALGTVTITTAGSAGGHLEFYDATTTNQNLRTGNPATTSIRIASIPNNAAAGDYTFDAVFKNGLIVFNTAQTNAGTSTVTCRY